MNADKLADALRTILDHVDGYVPNTPKAIWRDAQAALAEHDAQPAQAAQPGDDEAARRYIRDWCPDHVKDLIDRVAAQPVGVPDGWVMVPRGPTNDMVLAGIGAWSSQHANAIDIWHAMLAAAPQPPAQPSADAEVSNEMVLRAVHASLDWPHPLTHFEARKALEAAMAKESDAARAAEGGE